MRYKFSFEIDCDDEYHKKVFDDLNNMGAEEVNWVEVKE